MKTVKLVRHESSDQGTFGTIEVDGHVFFTGELPWRDDRNDLSCIPAGVYTCIPTYSQHFHKVLYLVQAVEHRSGVRIHPANLMGDATKGLKCQLLGCIALGEKVGWIGKQKALLVSAPAVRKFESLLKEEPFTLEIVECGALSEAS